MSETVFEVPPSGESLPEMDAPYPQRRKKGRRRKRAAETTIEMGSEEKQSEPVVVTLEQLTALITGTMSGLAYLIDESYEVVDKEGKLLPHVDVAAAQMLPWAQQYGGILVKSLPWVGLIGGLTMLLAPALEPTLEIISGVRNPRILRKDANDVYTEAYKRRHGDGPIDLEAVKNLSNQEN